MPDNRREFNRANPDKSVMRHLDLFSGIGGFALAASWVWGDEHEIVSFVEIDKFCQKVLKKHWPDVPVIDDIKDCNCERILAYSKRKRQSTTISVTRSIKRSFGETIAKNQGWQKKSESIKERTGVDLLTGGFPCQPYSVAGKQRGAKDDRAIWPQMLRVIREVRPTWVIGENVAGIINMELDQVLSDLEDSQYEVQPFLIPACGVDAPHRRDRVWIVAYSNKTRQREQRRSEPMENKFSTVKRGGQDVPISDAQRCNGRQDHERKEPAERNGVEEASDVGNPERSGLSGNNGRWAGPIIENRCQDVSDTYKLNGDESRLRASEVSQQQASGLSGLSKWLPEPNVGRVANGIPQRVDRLKSLGNAIVPQAVVPIMQAIKQIEEDIQ